HHLDLAPLGVAVGMLGVFYLLLLHLPAFRRLVVRGLQATWGVTRTVLIDVPAAVLRLPLIHRFLDSGPFLLFAHYVLKPLPVAALAWAALRGCGVAPVGAIAGGGAALVAASLLLNSRRGRDLEELLTDWTVRQWDYLRGLLPGLFRLVMGAFKRLLEAV